jgi:hypothetical protein
MDVLIPTTPTAFPMKGVLAMHERVEETRENLMLGDEGPHTWGVVLTKVDALTRSGVARAADLFGPLLLPYQFPQSAARLLDRANSAPWTSSSHGVAAPLAYGTFVRPPRERADPRSC